MTPTVAIPKIFLRSNRWNTHEGDGATLVLVDHFDLALIEWLRPRRWQNVQLYAWVKGPCPKRLAEMNIRVALVNDTLMANRCA